LPDCSLFAKVANRDKVVGIERLEIAYKREAELADRDQNSELKRESSLSEAKDELIAERTAELTKTNQVLQAEIDARGRAEEELSRNEALLRSIIDNSTSIIHLKDKDGRYIFVNCQFEAVFRIDEVDVKGKTDFDIFPRESAEVFRANDLKVAAAGAPVEFEEEILQNDGPHSYLSNKFPMFDSAGRLYAVCSISTDITEQRRLESSLRDSRVKLTGELDRRTQELVSTNQALLLANTQKAQALEALRRAQEFSSGLFDSAQVIVLLLDPAGRVVHYNPYLEQLSGHALDEAKGKDWFTTFLPARDRPRIRALFENVIRGTTVNASHNPITTKDGSEREIQWSARQLYGEDGELVGVLCSGIDITELRKAEIWSRSLLETTQDAVVAIDRQARITMFNTAAERIFGYTKAEVEGKKVNLLMAEPYAAEHDGYIARYEMTGEPHAIGRIRTVSARRKDGTIFPVELSVTQIASGREVTYAAFIRDITEKVKLQRQAIESERLVTIGTMAAKFGHELGNPLNGMSLTIQLLEQRLKKQLVGVDEQVAATLTRLKIEIARLNLLLQDFRSLSRKERYNFQPVSLSDLVGEAIEIELPRYVEQGIEVESTFSAGLPPITVDIDKMKQVILNLAKNAVDAMPTGGKLSFKGSMASGSVTLAISDTGAGIAGDVDIFEPFFTTKSFGTGIGLTIVRQIIQAHGGSISYQSEVGKGTIFSIHLPL
jgi:PAS domain S-box-containing protein